MILISLLALAVLLPAAVAAQDVPAAPPPPARPPIADNSFLLEEAYNQEPGVIQHISAFSRLGPGNWGYTFTEEWPAPRQTHQLSVTVPLGNAGVGSSVGDVLLNWRYQAKDGEDGVAFAPRLSLVLPTGSVSKGLGAGGFGLQGNLPLSWELGEPFVAHSNLGATWVPSAENEVGDEASALGFNAGQSLVWRATSRVNVMLELAWTRSAVVIGRGTTVHEDALYLNPGVRWAHDFASGLQIVPGIAVPVGLGPSRGDTGIFLYLSFEHPRERR